MKLNLCCAAILGLLTLEAVATPSGWPVRQPGLWQIDVQVGTAPPVQVRQCTSPEVDVDTFMSIVPAQENCRRQVHRLAQDKWRVATVCEIHGHAAHGDVRFEGDPKKAYNGSYSVRKPHQLPLETGSFRARYLGPCEASLKPGEMLLPNRVKVDTTQRHDEHDHQH